MALKRRGFLAGLGLILAAPALVRAESLMKLAVPRFILWGDGVHDDTAALQALLNGKRVSSDLAHRLGDGGVSLVGGVYRVTASIVITRNDFLFSGVHFIHG